MDSYEVTHEMLNYLVDRAIVAHISPDSTHAYEKLQEAWARIEARRVKATFPPEQCAKCGSDDIREGSPTSDYPDLVIVCNKCMHVDYR